MYRIRFCPYNPKDYLSNNSLSCHRVYSMDRNMILLFMKQHQFDMNQIQIETLPDPFEDDDMDTYELKFYKMQSNRTMQVHQIVSSDYYIDQAVEAVVQNLSDYLVFGETIFRRDIPFINLVNHYLDDIPFVFAFDYDILDGCPSCDTSYFNVKKDLEQFAEAIDSEYDTSSMDDLYNRFLFNVAPNEKLPITLEAYVRWFVKEVIMRKR